MANPKHASSTGRRKSASPLLGIGAAALVAAALITGALVGEIATEGQGSVTLDDAIAGAAALVLWTLGLIAVVAASGERREPPVIPSVHGLDDVDALVRFAHGLGFDWDGPDTALPSATIHLVATTGGITVGYVMAQPTMYGFRLSWLLVDPCLPFDEIADPLLDALGKQLRNEACVATVLSRDTVRRRLLARHGFVDGRRGSDSSSLLVSYPGGELQGGLTVIEVSRH